MLAVPALAQTYTREEAKGRAEALFDIEGYSNFEYLWDSDNNTDSSIYGMRWTFIDDSKYKEVIMRADGDLVQYKNRNTSSSDTDNDREYSVKECKETADKFIESALSGGLSSVKFRDVNKNMVKVSKLNDLPAGAYEFYYYPIRNGIENISEMITVYVGSKTNTVSKYYTEEDDKYAYNDFDTSSIEKASDKIKDGIQLGYMTIYNKNIGKYDVRLVYAFRDYQLDASSFEPVCTDYDMFTYAHNCLSQDPNKNVPDYLIETEPPSNAISKKKAVKIYNDFYGTDFSADDIDVRYGETYRRDDYLVYANELIIDSEGRIVGNEFYFNKDELFSDKSPFFEENLSEREIAQKIINKINVKNYELTDIRSFSRSSYGNVYYCNIKRNGLVSFNEKIYIEIDGSGKIYDIWVQYTDDEAFRKDFDINISEEEACDLAFEKMDFNPYYCIRLTDYSHFNIMTNIYGFRECFAINAENGIFYNHDREVIQTGEELLKDDINAFEYIVKNLKNYNTSIFM